MPYCLVIGISYEQFWHMNPRKIKPFLKAFQIQKRLMDEQEWMMGRYVYDAVIVAVNKNLAGSKSHMEYIDKPVLQSIEEQHMTEEQKILGTEALFKQLEIMQSNFEKSHPKQSNI